MNELTAVTPAAPIAPAKKDIAPIVDLSKEYPTFPPKTEDVIKNPEPILVASHQLVQAMNGEFSFCVPEQNWRLAENPDFSKLLDEDGRVIVAVAGHYVVGGSPTASTRFPAIVVQRLKGKYHEATPWVYFRKIHFLSGDLKRPEGPTGSIDDFNRDARDYFASSGFPVGMSLPEGTQGIYINMEVNNLRANDVSVYDSSGKFLDRSVNHFDLDLPGVLVGVNGGTRLYLGE